jgi:DNA-binding transcriptional LysR family regulator
LTDEGRKAYPAVCDLLHRYNHLIQSAEQPTFSQPDLTFACGRHAVLEFVRKALQAFCKAHPTVKFRVATLRGEERVAGVANGFLDLATVDFNPAVIEKIARRKLHVETIAVNRVGLVCAKSSPWAKKLGRMPKTKLSLDSLTCFPLVLPEPDAAIRRPLNHLLRDHELAGKLDIRMETGGWGTVLTYVRDKHGVGLIGESAVPSDRKLVVRYFDPECFAPSKTKLICRYRLDTDQRDLTPIAATFYQTMKRVAASRKTQSG